MVLIYAPNVLAEYRPVCYEPELKAGIAKISSYHCDHDNGLCGVNVSAPETYDSRKLKSVALTIGWPDHTQLNAVIEHSANDGIVQSEIFGQRETLAGYTIVVTYAAKDLCAVVSPVELRTLLELKEFGPEAILAPADHANDA